jgi:hypothetical protein
MLDSRHTHHLVPRAYGGLKGPTVDICADDHNTLHRLALRKANDPSVVLALIDKPKLYYLVSVVRRAKKLTSEDKNKRVQLACTISGDLGRKLEQIKNINGLNTTDAITMLIKDYHNRRFI